ncbi:hypothetical protein ACS0TY_014858 [Phlomoides rotata]
MMNPTQPWSRSQQILEFRRCRRRQWTNDGGRKTTTTTEETQKKGDWEVQVRRQAGKERTISNRPRIRDNENMGGVFIIIVNGSGCR